MSLCDSIVRHRESCESGESFQMNYYLLDFAFSKFFKIRLIRLIRGAFPLQTAYAE